MSTTNFEKHANTWNPISKYFLIGFSNLLVNQVRTLNPESILDVGAGEGFTLQTLRKNHIGEKLEGLEYSDEAIALGKKFHPDIFIKKGDIYKLPYKDNTFDVVICSEVLEHLEDPTAALKELIRVSKKYCALSVPNEPYFTIQRLLRGKDILKFGDHPEHIQHWTSRSFRAFVDQYLKIKLFKTPLPWTMIIAEK